MSRIYEVEMRTTTEGEVMSCRVPALTGAAAMSRVLGWKRMQHLDIISAKAKEIRPMKAVRHTAFLDPSNPITAITLESDMKDGALNGIEDELTLPGVFSLTEVFEVKGVESGDEGDALMKAIMQAGERVRERAPEEINMAIGYYWNAEQLQKVRAGGVLMNPARAPYGVSDVETMLTQLAQHPNYKPGVTIRCTAKDGSIVAMADGRTFVEDTP